MVCRMRECMQKSRDRCDTEHGTKGRPDLEQGQKGQRVREELCWEAASSAEVEGEKEPKEPPEGRLLAGPKGGEKEFQAKGTEHITSEQGRQQQNSSKYKVRTLAARDKSQM